MNTSLTELNIQDLMQHPAEYFHTPQELEKTSLPTDQKLALLEQWKDEVIQRQNARDENMSGKDEALLLQTISNIINRLSDEVSSI